MKRLVLNMTLLGTCMVFADQPYVGEIIITGHNFCPAGYMEASGQLLPISENETLFQLIGTTYGGDGEWTFALPNLNGRVPIHRGTASNGINYVQGETVGTEQITLTQQQLPNHNHSQIRLDAESCIHAKSSPETKKSVNTSDKTTVLAVTQKKVYCDTPTPGDSLNEVVAPTSDWVPANVAPAGGNQPIDIRSPSLVLRYCISLFGIFPSPQ